MPGPAIAPGPPSAGLFGKLPGHRDFVRRSLPESFVAPWDAWLRGAIQHSRERLGEEWLPAFLEAPVWRFALAPGVCGPAGAAGVLAPSVDAVGRHFPLTLAILTDTPPDPTIVGWFDHLDTMVANAVTESWATEALMTSLAAMPVPPDGRALSGSIWATEGAPRVAARSFALAGLPPPTAFAGMLADAAAETAPP